MLAEVETLYDTNCRDIPAMLRRLADAIEAGDHPGTSSVVCVLEADELSVFGWGETDGYHSIGLLETAKVHIMD